MSELIRSAKEVFRLNSRMVELGLDDISAEDAIKRWKNGEGSSIAYLTGHVSSSRCGLLKALGAGTENPYAELFGGDVGSQDGSAYPPLSELHAGWVELAERFHSALDAITDQALMESEDGAYPSSDKTLRGRIGFLAWHETYHVGQIGILRTEMGYPSLRQALYAAKQG